MDLRQTLKTLYAERQQLQRTIAALEQLDGSAGTRRGASDNPKKRGRKFMGSAERKQVGERMKRYWAEWRRRQQPKDAAS
ncbi:MAG: hypothetical protein C5B51_01685 [Terriglobia bacterium]|nr:MAG: hypothetical protein C5B51_01685 [Terriglobia bacterium]